jgi:hypothetical protein
MILYPRLVNLHNLTQARAKLFHGGGSPSDEWLAWSLSISPDQATAFFKCAKETLRHRSTGSGKVAMNSITITRRSQHRP